MNTNILIQIRNRVAQLTAEAHIVNGCNIFTVIFDFDSEWDEYPEKTARFAYCDRNGVRRWIDVPFTDNICEVPILRKISEVHIEVYAGNIRTTTCALVQCRECITDIPAEPYVPKKDPAREILQQINDARKNRR